MDSTNFQTSMPSNSLSIWCAFLLFCFPNLHYTTNMSRKSRQIPDFARFYGSEFLKYVVGSPLSWIKNASFPQRISEEKCIRWFSAENWIAKNFLCVCFSFLFFRPTYPRLRLIGGLEISRTIHLKSKLLPPILSGSISLLTLARLIELSTPSLPPSLLALVISL